MADSYFIEMVKKWQLVLDGMKADGACEYSPPFSPPAIPGGASTSLILQFSPAGFMLAQVGAMSKRTKTMYLQEPLFHELKRYICYVCHRWIKNDGLNVGNGIWRHAKCKPMDVKSLRDKIITKSL